jgi:hypothetical protein
MPLFSASGNCCVSHLRVDNHDRDGGRTLLAVWHLVNAPIPAPGDPGDGPAPARPVR